MNGLEEFSYIEYLNNHEILWFPINLTITDGKKELKPVYDKNGKFLYMPKQTDFKELSKEVIKQRQDNNDFEFIAVDTSHYYHIDIDTPDYPECFDEMMKEAPFIKSITKDYGRHIFITSDFKPETLRTQFNNKGVELLNGQWSYARLTMYNNKPPLFIDGDELKQQLVLTQKQKYESTETDNEQSDDDDKDKAKYIELLFNVIKNGKHINYDTWFNIMACLKANGYSFDIFKKYTELYQDNHECAKYWDNLKNPYGTIHYLQKLAKEFNYDAYRSWLSKYNTFLSLSTLNLGANDIMKFITPFLKDELKYCNEWYSFQKNGTWKIINNPTAIIINSVQSKINESTECLLNKINKCTDEEERKRLDDVKKAYFKHYQLINATGFLSVSTKCLMDYLCDSDFIKKLDIYTYKIFYKNGMLDLKTMEFRKGLKSNDYITKTLDYNYEQPDTEEIEFVRENLKKICNYDEEHLNYYLSCLGYAMTGDAEREQLFYYLRGETASNGKSLIFEVLEKIMPVYVRKTCEDVFDKNADVRKDIDAWSGIKLLWTNELSTKQKNENLLKAVCDGTSYEYKKLWSKSTVSMPINFKLFLVSNNTIKVNADAGIRRRFKIMQFNSQFKDEYNNDIDKLEFKRDKDLNEKLTGKYKHALMHLIFNYSSMYNKDKKLKPYPKIWNIEGDCVMNENDSFKEWFDENFELGEDFMIHKNDFDDILKEYEGHKNINAKDCIKRLKNGVIYDSQGYIMLDGKRKKGIWKGMRLIQE